MNNQNRMNAGAEYVLYRLWATLQDRRGIHAESLLTCLGALAGYSCQACVRQTAALPGVDLAKYALATLEARDGTRYVSGDALSVPLSESPLSICALVSLTLRKLGEPPPDLEDIFDHVAQTVGTRAFGVPRVPGRHRPRRPAIVYLRQVWPQILPIAQRFCRKPMQMPLLFGIALQRAIEVTRELLSPALAASIALECAVAMSKVALPGADADIVARPPSVAMATEINSAPLASAPPARRSDTSPARARANRVPRRRGALDEEMSASTVWAFVANLSPATRIVTATSVAIMIATTTFYKADRGEAREVLSAERAAPSQPIPQGLPVLAEPVRQAQIDEETPRLQQTEPPEPPPDEDISDAPANDDAPPPPDPTNDGSSDIMMSATSN